MDDSELRSLVDIDGFASARPTGNRPGNGSERSSPGSVTPACTGSVACGVGGRWRSAGAWRRASADVLNTTASVAAVELRAAGRTCVPCRCQAPCCSDSRSFAAEWNSAAPGRPRPLLARSSGPRLFGPTQAVRSAHPLVARVLFRNRHDERRPANRSSTGGGSSAQVPSSPVLHRRGRCTAGNDDVGRGAGDGCERAAGERLGRGAPAYAGRLRAPVVWPHLPDPRPSTRRLAGDPEGHVSRCA